VSFGRVGEVVVGFVGICSRPARAATGRANRRNPVPPGGRS